jgi:two-component system, LytTR family, response regulator
MVSTIIIDDERNNIEALKKLLDNFAGIIELRGTAENAEDGYSLIKEIKPQLVFLDIELPFGNAFDLLEKLMPIDFEVIFFTAFDQYAIKAIKYGVLDYLLKPVNQDDLGRAIHRAINRMAEKNSNARLQLFLETIRSEDKTLQKIALPTKNGLTFEDIQSITHLEATGSYTTVYFNNQRKEVVTKTLKEFEDILPSALFCRLHHSYIINLQYIKKYYKGRGGYVELNDGTVIEVSLRKKADFLKKFGI